MFDRFTRICGTHQQATPHQTSRRRLSGGIASRLACSSSAFLFDLSTGVSTALLRFMIDPAGGANTVAGANDQQRNTDVEDHVSPLDLESGESQQQ